ncbi:MAG: hypothetical protein ACJ74S_06245, partial [Gaiellaceae bacterium]
MAEEPDRGAAGADLERAACRNREARAEPQQRRLARAVRPGDDEEAAARKLEIETAQEALVAVALLKAGRAD